MPNLSLAARFLRFMLRNEIPGQTRLLYAMANQMPSLQAVPIEFADRPPVFVDLRHGQGWIWLRGSPWVSAPDESDEQELIRRILKPSDVVYDIGANIGLYTTLFSQLAHRVIAFEPNPQVLRTLRLTIAHLKNVEVFSVALSATDGVAPLYVPNDHTMASLADYTADEALTEWKTQIGLSRASVTECETTTLDHIIERGAAPPDFIKCDVEGAELRVFQGGLNLFSGPKAPLVLFEILEMCSNGFGVDKLAAAAFLEELGYKLFDVGPEGNLAPMVLSPHRVNVLAVPPGNRFTGR